MEKKITATVNDIVSKCKISIQVPHTYAYHDSTYGALNEHGVAVGESTCSSVFFTCPRGAKTGCKAPNRLD